jgi:hypothetical protein
MLGEFVRSIRMFGLELFPSAVTFTEHAATRAFHATRRAVIGALFLLAVVGCLRTMLRGGSLPGLWLWGGAGVLASVPFVFLDGGWRVIAPVWPGMTAWFAIALATQHRVIRFAAPTAQTVSKWPRWLHPIHSALPHPLVLGGVVVAAAIAPPLGHYLAGHARLRVARGDTNAEQVCLPPIYSEAPIRIIANEDSPEPLGVLEHDADEVRRAAAATGARVLTWREFQRRLQHGKIEASDLFRMATGGPPSTLQQCYDVQTQQLVWVAWSQRESPEQHGSDPPVGAEPSGVATRGWLPDMRRLSPPYFVRVKAVSSVPFIARGIGSGVDEPSGARGLP